ncbi:hypothetical protein BGZ63DRAFT_405674 [Mariannaea sp. PMI_226]|nr:hypothetical protein BGZ63DRAFT_405674 [Mariannaea sp. PMI_226]
MFHLLKVKNSYHDNIERLNVSKWMVQLSAEIGLPQWMEYEVMEICICEAIKTSWHQPLNRYSWIVEREISKSDMAYHSDHVVMMGHMFSMLARVFPDSNEQEQKFWTNNVNYIVEAARRITAPKSGKLQSVAQAEKWLALDISKLKKKLIALFTEQCKGLGVLFTQDPSIFRRNERMRQAVKDRKERMKKSAEFVTCSDESEGWGSSDGEASGDEASGDGEVDVIDIGDDASEEATDNEVEMVGIVVSKKRLLELGRVWDEDHSSSNPCPKAT